MAYSNLCHIGSRRHEGWVGCYPSGIEAYKVSLVENWQDVALYHFCHKVHVLSRTAGNRPCLRVRADGAGWLRVVEVPPERVHGMEGTGSVAVLRVTHSLASWRSEGLGLPPDGQ